MKKNARIATSLLLSLGLVAAACSSDDPEATPTEEVTTTVVADDGEMEEASEFATVVEVAQSSDDFSVLVEAVVAADLAETLSGEGPFTVFAPTNDAFVAALDDLGLTKEELLASPDLASILTYHVVPGKILAADAIAADGSDIATVNGETVAISVVDGAVMVNGATVTTADLEAGNGVVHVIDTVILPGQ